MLTFLLPPVRVTFTNRRVYVMRFFARPLGVFFFSWGSTYNFKFISYSSLTTLIRGWNVVLASVQGGKALQVHDASTSCSTPQYKKYCTFGVWDLTFPARARDPWTFPMIAVYRLLFVMAFRSVVAKDISWCFLVSRRRQTWSRKACETAVLLYKRVRLTSCLSWICN